MYRVTRAYFCPPWYTRCDGPSPLHQRMIGVSCKRDFQHLPTRCFLALGTWRVWFMGEAMISIRKECYCGWMSVLMRSTLEGLKQYGALHSALSFSPCPLIPNLRLQRACSHLMNIHSQEELYLNATDGCLYIIIELHWEKKIALCVRTSDRIVAHPAFVSKWGMLVKMCPS